MIDLIFLFGQGLCCVLVAQCGLAHRMDLAKDRCCRFAFDGCGCVPDLVGAQVSWLDAGSTRTESRGSMGYVAAYC